jgi:hypothetical protein
MRQLFGIITALTTAVLIIFMAQFIREGIFPFPTGFNTNKKEDVIRWLATLPTKGYIIMSFSHGLASFAAGYITSLTVGRKRMTLGVLSVILILCTVLAYAFIYKLPITYIAVDALIMIVLGVFGALMGSNRYDI